jgi:hypothetical protein
LFSPSIAKILDTYCRASSLRQPPMPTLCAEKVWHEGHSLHGNRPNAMKLQRLILCLMVYIAWSCCPKGATPISRRALQKVQREGSANQEEEERSERGSHRGKIRATLSGEWRK